MGDEAYRLWQHWQQMHYPRRGLPTDESARARLVTPDGTAGTVLDRYFRRGARARMLDASALVTLDRCRHELEPTELAADASRYFGRLRQLIDLMLAEARPDRSGRPVLPSEPMAAKQLP